MGWHGDQMMRLATSRAFQRSVMAVALAANLFTFFTTDWRYGHLFSGFCICFLVVAQAFIEVMYRDTDKRYRR